MGRFKGGTDVVPRAAGDRGEQKTLLGGRNEPISKSRSLSKKVYRKGGENAQ